MSAADPVPQAVHDDAAAVFSRAFSFVEWKFAVASGDPFATGERGGKPPYRDIFPKGTAKGERWIYVFSRAIDEPFTLKEEIRLLASGDLAATPADHLFDRGRRPAPEPLGKTMVLPRRSFGRVLEYRFYASRVPLPLALIRMLEGRNQEGNPDPKAPAGRRIDQFAPRVFLDPGENNSVFERDGKLLVPVIDPVAIMLNWHASFEEAVTDYVNYTTPHRGLNGDQRAKVARRRKKQLLAELMHQLLAEEDKAGKKDLESQLAAGGRQAIASFVADYEAQARGRLRWRDLTAAMLTRWLQSGAIATAAAAHDADSAAARQQFRTLWWHAHTGLAASPEGRAYLAGFIEGKEPVAYARLWSTESRTDDQVQGARKASVSAIEAFKSIVEAAANPHDLKASWRATPEDVEKRLSALMGFEKGTLTVELVTKDVAGKSLKVDKIAFDVSYEKKRPFKGANGFIAAIEGINFLLAVAAAREQLGSLDPQQREQVIIGLVGSALDVTTAMGKLLHASESALRVMSFVSGVIDVYLAHGTMQDRYALGDQGGAKGSFIVAAGSTLGTSAVMLEAMGFAGAVTGPFAVLAMAIVAVGYIYKHFYQLSPLQLFFGHSEWGKSRDESAADTPSWSPVNYKEWHGTVNGYDHQLQALLNIVCQFEMGEGKRRHQLAFKFGWLPPGVKLVVGYKEGVHVPLQGTVTFFDEGPTATATGPAVANLTGPFVASNAAPGSQLTLTATEPTLQDKSTEVSADARLFMKLRDVGAFQIPSGTKPVHAFFRN